MAYTVPPFQGAPFVQPRQYPDIGAAVNQGIQGLFDNYIRYKQFQQQQALGNLQGLVNYNVNPSTLTNSDISQAQQLSQNAPLPGQGQGMYQNPGAPMYQQGNVAQGASDNALGLAQALQMHRQSLLFGAAQAQAGLFKSQGEAREANIRPDLLGAPSYEQLLNPQIQSNQPHGQNVISGTVDQVQAGNLDPEGMFDASGRDPMVRLAMQNEANKRGINQIGLHNRAENLQKQATSVGEVQGGVTQKIGAAAGTLEDILNQARPLVKQLSPTQIQAVNNAWVKGLKSIKNDPVATQFLTLMGEARGKYSQVLGMGNAPGQSEKDSANESIGRGLDPDAYDAMASAVNFAAGSTIKRLGGRGYKETPPQDTGLEKVALKGADGKIRYGLYQGNKFKGWAK